MITIRLEPEDISLEWCMNPPPEDIASTFGLKGPDEITEHQIKALLIVLAAYKEVYGDDIVHNTPTTAEKDCEVFLSTSKGWAESYGNITITDEINSAMKKKFAKQWQEPGEYWFCVIHKTAAGAYQMAARPPEVPSGILEAIVAEMKE